MPQTIRTSIHNMLLYFIKRRHQSAITAHSYMQSRPGIRKAVPRYQNWRTRNCRSKNWRSKIGESELGFQKLWTGLVWFVYPGAVLPQWPYKAIRYDSQSTNSKFILALAELAADKGKQSSRRSMPK